MAGLTNIGIKDAAGSTQTIEVYDTGTGGPYGSAVVLFNGGSTVLGVYAEDAAHTTGDTGLLALAKRTDTAAVSSGTDGDYSTINVDATGRLWCNVNLVTPGTAATNLGKAEDAAHTSADVGVMALAVRQDTPGTALAGTDGDYIPLVTSSTGGLYVWPGTAASDLGKAEDAAHSSADVGVMALAVRRDTAASSSGTAGDYSTINVDANGRLWARTLDDGVSWTSAFGVTSAAVTSANASVSPVAVTDAPTGTQKIVVDQVVVSVDTNLAVTFACETTGVVIWKLYLLANTVYTIKPVNKIKLATADKKLTMQTSAAGNIAVTCEFHSEA